MAAPLQDVFSLASWGGGTDEFGNPSYLQTGADPTAALATGAFTPRTGDVGGQGFQVDWSKLPKTAAGTSAAGWTPWANNTDKLINPKLLINDPNYGWITPGLNIKQDHDFLTTVGNMMPLIIATLMSAGGGALAGAGLGGTLFSDAMKVLFSKGGG